jgi:hypothetical protein
MAQPFCLPLCDICAETGVWPQTAVDKTGAAVYTRVMRGTDPTGLEAQTAREAVMGKIIIDIPDARDYRFKAWRKLVTGVDTTKTNGYAFLGEFLRTGRKAEVEVGSLIMLYDEVGSHRYHLPHVRVARVSEDGTLETLVERKSSADWALEIRDQVAALFRQAATDELTSLRAEAEALRARLAEVEARIASLTEEA